MTTFCKGADGRSLRAVCESSGRLICESSGFSFWKPKEKHFLVKFWRILSPGAPHSHPSHFSLSAAKRYVSQQIKNYRDFIKTSKVVNRVSWSPRLSKRKSVVFLPRAMAKFQLVAAAELQCEHSPQQQPTFSYAILRHLSYLRVHEPVPATDKRYRGKTSLASANHLPNYLLIMQRAKIISFPLCIIWKLFINCRDSGL